MSVRTCAHKQCLSVAVFTLFGHAEPPLVCPEATGFGLCAEFCSADTPCPDGQLCCSNGCGHSCMAGVPPAANCSDVSDWDGWSGCCVMVHVCVEVGEHQ